jgi:hypothetical protein
MTAANPDAPREFYDTPVRDLGDPATDPPLTIRVQGGQDRWTRLFDPIAVRAIKTTEGHWVLVGGDTEDIGEDRYDDEVRGWPVMPALFASTPWGDTNHGPTLADHLTTRHDRGDMDADAFKGGPQ